MKPNFPPNKRSKLVQFEEVCISDKLRIVWLGVAIALTVLTFYGSGAAQTTSCTLGVAYPDDLVYKVDNVIICTGQLYSDPNLAHYVVYIPSDTNGSLEKWTTLTKKTLILWNHGLAPLLPNPYPPDFTEPISNPPPNRATYSHLLKNGYALAGASYLGGWTVKDAFNDQIKLLDTFPSLACSTGCTTQPFGSPGRTIASGGSLGGLIAAGLVQKYPQYFSGALPMCGIMAGGVGLWNTALDLAFAFKTLLAPDRSLQLVNISDPLTNFYTAINILNSAQNTAAGRARIALAAALADVPGWFDPLSLSEPTDYVTQEASQYLWFSNVDFPLIFAGRADLEYHAGGNPSWNTGVDYRNQLEVVSADYQEVKALYEEAGLDLDADLQTLAAAQRISADRNAVDYLRNFISFNGNIQVPVLSLHDIGDGAAVVENEQAYKQVITHAGNNGLLRLVFVNRAGHCTFTPAEQIVALQALMYRLDTGKWQGVGADDLNSAASALGPALNIFSALGPGYPSGVPTAPAFVDFDPAPFLRPFNFDDVYPGN